MARKTGSAKKAAAKTKSKNDVNLQERTPDSLAEGTSKAAEEGTLPKAVAETLLQNFRALLRITNSTSISIGDFCDKTPSPYISDSDREILSSARAALCRAQSVAMSNIQNVGEANQLDTGW